MCELLLRKGTQTQTERWQAFWRCLDVDRQRHATPMLTLCNTLARLRLDLSCFSACTHTRRQPPLQESRYCHVTRASVSISRTPARRSAARPPPSSASHPPPSTVRPPPSTRPECSSGGLHHQKRPCQVPAKKKKHKKPKKAKKKNHLHRLCLYMCVCVCVSWILYMCLCVSVS